jgi:hypothetical protein
MHIPTHIPTAMAVRTFSQFELKITTMEDLMKDTPLMDRRTVAAGTPDEIYEYVKARGLVWRNAPNLLFLGYWYDAKNGEAYIPV